MKYMRFASGFRVSLNMEYPKTLLSNVLINSINLLIFFPRRKTLMITNVKDRVIGESVLIQTGKN